MGRLIAVIQTRMGSSRLPGKVLLPLAGESVLARVVRSVRDSDAVDDVVVATTIEERDDAVEAECANLDVPVHRGPVDDVLTRFMETLAEHPADALVRVTADCPLLDPEVIRMSTSVFRALEDLDYLSTGLVRTLPRGLDVEIVSASALAQADKLAESHHRAHVTSYLYTQPDAFRLVGLTFAPEAPELRVTLDTREDLDVIEQVVLWAGRRHVPWRELVAWLRGNPRVASLNRHVEQKPLAEG